MKGIAARIQVVLLIVSSITLLYFLWPLWNDYGADLQDQAVNSGIGTMWGFDWVAGSLAFCILVVLVIGAGYILLRKRKGGRV